VAKECRKRVAGGRLGNGRGSHAVSHRPLEHGFVEMVAASLAGESINAADALRNQ
jgi:hypothetical protein